MAVNYEKTQVTDWNGVVSSTGQSWGSWSENRRASAQATAGNAARAYQGAADDSYAAAIGAANQGLGLAKQGISALNGVGSNINTGLSALNKNYKLATDAALSMNGNISAVEDSAMALKPYATDLTRYADTLWDQGNTLFGQGQNNMALGNSLMNLDANAGGIVGKYVSWLNSIDPNRYVAMAASDVQNSFSNAQGQLNRNLMRAGSDASSTRTAAMQQQMAQSLAAALAGAKTRARQQGLSDHGNALRNALTDAQNMISQGAEISSTGANVEKGAADIKSAAAQVEAKSGELSAAAAGLRADQSGVLTQAGQLMAKYGDLSLGTAQALVTAYGNAADASTALAKIQSDAGMYYAQVAQGYGEMAGDYLFGASSNSQFKRATTTY